VADVCREEEEETGCVVADAGWSLGRGDGGTEFRSGAIVSELYVGSDGNAELWNGEANTECVGGHVCSSHLKL
jgi:hypothetical protein